MHKELAMSFDEIDPTKLGFDLEIKDLTREIVITVSAQDDEAFKLIAAAATEIQDAWNKELAEFKKEQAQKKSP
jgi:hypothetical protein